MQIAETAQKAAQSRTAETTDEPAAKSCGQSCTAEVMYVDADNSCRQSCATKATDEAAAETVARVAQLKVQK